MPFLQQVFNRLERAWCALVDEPRDVGGIAGRTDIILTGPLPVWMQRALEAQARISHRTMADVVYIALRAHAKSLVADMADQGAQKGTPE